MTFTRPGQDFYIATIFTVNAQRLQDEIRFSKFGATNECK